MKKIKIVSEEDLKKEADSFDIQTDERIKAGFIPDLRRLKKLDWFYNNVWRDPEFVKIHLMPKINFVIGIAKRKGGKVLELGCGYGYLSLELARNGLDVVGVDLSPKSIEVAKKFAEENQFKENFGYLKYECADIMSMDLGEETFNSIIFFSTLHHMPNIHLLFPKLQKALKKGGNLIIVEPLRGEFTKKSAEFVVILRAVLPFYIVQKEKLENLNLKKWKEHIQDIYDEYTFAGEHEQSPNDNLTNKAEMIINVTKKYFNIEKIQYSDAFLEKMIGGLRGENKYELARLLKFLDDKLVKEKILPFTNIQIHAVKKY